MLTRLPSLLHEAIRFIKELLNIRIIRASGMFDEVWYLSNNHDIAQAGGNPLIHYLRHGGFEERDPSLSFSSKAYLDTYPDVKNARINPLVHYLKYGKKEGRNILPVKMNKEKKVKGSIKNNMNILQDKLDLIDFAFGRLGCESFADLGGVWGVDGGYTFYALDKFNPRNAILVDTHPSDDFNLLRRNYPQLRFVKGNFGEENVAKMVGQVDAVFLFDVLLHQVAPDWDRIIETYATRTKCMIIYNQQWIGSFETVRLLDFGEDGYFKNTPHRQTEEPYVSLFQKLDQKHPDHDRTWRDVHHIWQWGITDVDLQSKIESLGFQLQYYINFGKCANLENFENHGFIFIK